MLNFVNLSDLKYNFDKKTGLTDDKSHGYDYASIMQYGPRAFSRNGRNTITAKNGASLGQTQELSEGDIAQANTMYCVSTGGTGTGTGTGRYCKMYIRVFPIKAGTGLFSEAQSLYI